MAGKPKLNLNSPITDVPGIGPATSSTLAKLKIFHVSDLLRHYPRKFLDYTKPSQIDSLEPKKTVFLVVTISKIKTFKTRGGKSITTALATDSTGTINLSWFNNFYLSKTLRENQQYYLTGTTTHYNGKLSIISPTLELPDPNSLNTGRLVPIYPLTEGIKSKFLRKAINFLLSHLNITDPLDLNPSLTQAINQIHFPPNLQEHDQADYRLSLNQHFLIAYQNFLQSSSLPPAYSLSVNAQFDQELRAKIPFTLTHSQDEVIAQSYSDLTKNHTTHRLIQGETGSGKTMVMLFLAYQAIKQHTSFVLLCPTKILASQHAATFQKFLSNQSIQLVTADEKSLDTDHPSIFIGTQSLIKVLPKNLSNPVSILCVDEQHRFGVSDREALISRNPTPHLFNFSATPIPRTLALGFFGDVSISTIKHKPRQNQIKTVITQNTKFETNLAWFHKKLDENAKIFAVTPSIREHDSGQASVLKQFKFYQQHFPNQPIFLIHGQMRPDQIAANLADFKEAKSGILVSTSIIEVGIDIPEAEIIIIHSAERFGLASLHQLRGRVGRGTKTGYCILIPSHENLENTQRLKLLTKYHKGINLAKHDWALRGGGDITGDKQHGHLPINLKHFWDKDTYQEAKNLVHNLATSDPAKLAQIAASLQAW